MKEYIRLAFELTDGLYKTGEEILNCAMWLCEFGTANALSLNDLHQRCRNDKEWLLEEIF